jgi:predicted nucleic acid-binding protein
MKVYLDACCVNRPFDDQSQDRIRLEAEAVLLIIKHFENNEWSWCGSDVLNFEIDQIPNLERRQRVRQIVKYAHSVVALDSKIVSRAKQIEELGFAAYDALHIASAEDADCDVFLTTDDRLLHIADRSKDQMKINISNPLIWLNERLAK